MSESTSSYFYPNRMGRIILMAMDEIMGREGFIAALNLASLSHLIDKYPPPTQERQVPFETISGLQCALEEAFGSRGGRGFALRIGRACFKYGLREFGSQMGLTEMAFRLLPLSTKLRIGGNAFADLFNDHTDQQVRFELGQDKLYWFIDRCPLCWGRHVDQPACHLAVGLLQESLYWVSGGRIFDVAETQCIAKGDPSCTIEIDRTPIS